MATIGPIKRKELASSVSPEATRSKRRIQEGDTCKECNSVIRDDVECSIECQWCHSWVHGKCSNLNDEECTILSKSNINLVYLCTTCLPNLDEAHESFDDNKGNPNESYNELRSQMFSVATQVKDLISSNNQLQKQIETINTSIKDINRKSYAVATQASNSPTSNSSELSESPPAHLSSQSSTPDELRNAVSAVINEEKEKQKRKLNLIVHNMDESSADHAQTRKEHDITMIRDILGSQLEVKSCISNAIRLGRKGGPKPRLLKITVESEEEKVAILRNVKKLRLPSTPEHLKRMFITPDLTQKEREVNKALRSELAERNKSGKQFRIKNGRIVQRRE